MVVKQSTAIAQLMALKEKSSKMRLAAEAWGEPWQTLIAIMMSAQSRDELTIEIAKSLFEKYPSLKSLANAKHKDVLDCLKSLNYNQTKAKHIILTAKLLAFEYNGKVPNSIDELIKLPGVGRKTANVFLSEYGHQAIGVDTHVSYCSQKLGWTLHKHPEKIENDLKNLFPQKYWSQVNSVLVRFGKTFTSKRQKDEILNEIKKIN